MTQAMCPECAAPVNTEPDVRVSEILHCRQCTSELEVISVSPLAIALAPEIEEDWGE